MLHPDHAYELSALLESGPRQFGHAIPPDIEFLIATGDQLSQVWPYEARREFTRWLLPGDVDIDLTRSPGRELLQAINHPQHSGLARGLLEHYRPDMTEKIRIELKSARNRGFLLPAIIFIALLVISVMRWRMTGR